MASWEKVAVVLRIAVKGAGGLKPHSLVPWALQLLSDYVAPMADHAAPSDTTIHNTQYKGKKNGIQSLGKEH